MKDLEELVGEVRSRNLILFVGSGISRCLGLPSWDSLLKKLGSQLNYDPDIFIKLDSYLALAEFYRIKAGGIGELRSELNRDWHKSDIQIEDSVVHNLILKLNCPLIYTTNYDEWLERAYQKAGKPFTKISNVKDLLRVTPEATQIIKFHGDFTDDSSLVLTESDYFRRLSFEDPMDIKLRADLLAKPVLFIGYSLTDINMRYLLYKVASLWTDPTRNHLRPQSYIFLTKPNPVQEAILHSRKIAPIVSDTDDSTDGLVEFLKQLA